MNLKQKTTEKEAIKLIQDLCEFFGFPIKNNEATLTNWKHNLMHCPMDVVAKAFEIYKRSGDRMIAFSKVINLIDKIWADEQALVHQRGVEAEERNIRKLCQGRGTEFERKAMSLIKDVLNKEKYLVTEEGQRRFLELYGRHPDVKSI